MKTTVKIACLLAVLITACKKSSTHQQGYTYTTAYRNELEVPVEIRRGRLLPNAPYQQDTIVYRDTLMIAAHGMYEEEQFICTGNCNEGLVYETSYETPAYIGKVVINGKERIDTSCLAKAYFLKQQFFKCEELLTGAPNIYDSRQFKETRDGGGNITRREYVFDAADLAMAQ